MPTTIITTTAHLHDTAQMTAFLAAIPNGEELAKVLRAGEPITTRAYEDEVFTARFVTSDGIVVTCFTVPDITIDQAELIAIDCEALAEWDEAGFRTIAERVLSR